MKTKTWRGVRGEYRVEVEPVSNGAVDASTRHRLPLEVAMDISAYSEITIHFEANGSFNPGCMYLRNGDPGYPPERDEERLFVAATIREHGSKEEVRLPDDVGRKLFDMYEQQIQEVDLDYTEEDDHE